MAAIQIGISGWAYPKWRGVFYPEGLAAKNELFFASRLFHTIEINSSFYRLQSPSIYRTWFDQTPSDFVFSVKGSRSVSHLKKFNEIEAPLANFFASGVLELGSKLGPILWQIPPQLKLNLTRMESFLQVLPKNFMEAYELARHHDDRAKNFEEVHHPSLKHHLRYAFEVRHDSYKDPAFAELLKKYDAALVFADSAGEFTFSEEITTDFIYIRLHGDKEIDASGYHDEALDRWASKIHQWIHSKRHSVKKVFVYFDNDAKAKAPFDALDLSRKLGLLKNNSVEVFREIAR